MLFSCQGYHGDTSKTFLCGNVDDEAKKLVEVCFMTSKAIHMCATKNLFICVQQRNHTSLSYVKSIKRFLYRCMCIFCWSYILVGAETLKLSSVTWLIASITQLFRNSEVLVCNFESSLTIEYHIKGYF